MSVKATAAGYYDGDDYSGVFRNLSLISSRVMQVWVDYDGRRTEINVTLAPVRVPKPKRPLLSNVIDLSTVITDTSYIGFAASLGSMSSPHCILGWSFSLNGSAPSLDYSKLPKLPAEAPSSSNKVLKRVSHDSRQGIREFVAEITSIDRLQHRNLVPLLGYCRQRGELLLVYEYMPNGSLDKYLYDHQRKPALEWGKRFRIIKDIALGLFYLHNNCEQVIIHRDVKASNVLLDGEMRGHLGDFGLARLHDHGANPLTTRVVGTIGYLAPELARTCEATPLTDVFAFSVFLLEITCGRQPIVEDARGDPVLFVDWVLERWSSGGSLEDCVDARLQGEYDAGEVRQVLKLGLLCTQASPNARPSMLQVGQYLDGSLRFPELSLATSLDLSTMASMHGDGFDSYVMWYPTSSEASDTSHGTVSDLSGGR